MKLYGINPVLERIRSNPQSIQRIYVQEGHPETGYFRTKGKKWGIPVIVVPASKMAKIGRSRNTQGVLIDVEDFSYIQYPDLLETARSKKYTLIFLDGVTDPQNLGGILRSTACLGKFAVVLPTHDSVSVTEAVLRVATGGDNYVKVAQVANLNNAIRKAKEEGFWIAGTVTEEGEDLKSVKFNFPLGLVIGSEHKGIRDVIKKNLDLAVTIPMAYERLSLNVAHATAIFCYEIAKQKTQQKK